MPKTDTVTELLDAAQQMVQERGFNAFSYKDLAAAVGIRTASIHYHFPSKADLGKALMQRYLTQLEEQLAQIDRRSRTDRARLKNFIETYRGAESAEVLCLCGSLAADVETLRADVGELVDAYLTRSEAWVLEKLEHGARSGELDPRGGRADLAAALIASLQGGLLVSRARRQAVLDRVQRSFLKSLSS